MDLFILRHGIAADLGVGTRARDADRALTPKGKHEMWQVARAMKLLDLSFDLILSSPYTRVSQTAEIVAEALSLEKKLELTDCLMPHGSARELISLPNKHKPAPQNVLLVGHEPYLSQLISLLISGGSTACVTLKKAALAKLSTDSLKFGHCATLKWLLTPKQMFLLR
jgi:phosphohistidine phosphatase